MKKYLTILIMAATVLMSCKDEKVNVNKNSVLVPTFEIKVDLDERAEREMRAKNETIKVSLWISGIPRKDSGIKGNDKASGLVLGFFEKEINNEGIVKFEGLKIPERLYRALEDKDYGITINVVSGRKSSDVNLLYCESIDKGIIAVAGKQHTIKCKLIKDMWK